jgi:hypothetical protein
MNNHFAMLCPTNTVVEHVTPKPKLEGSYPDTCAGRLKNDVIMMINMQTGGLIKMLRSLHTDIL